MLQDLGYSNDNIKKILDTEEYNNALISTCELKHTSVAEHMNIIIHNALDHVELLVVDEVKGFKLIDKANISFCRITSGGPRCQVHD